MKISPSGKLYLPSEISKRRPLIESVQIDRFGFDVELIYLARLAGLRLSEIPVRWNNDAASKVSVIRDSFRMVDEVWRIRRAAAQGVYDAGIKAARSAAAEDRARAITA